MRKTGEERGERELGACVRVKEGGLERRKRVKNSIEYDNMGEEREREREREPNREWQQKMAFSDNGVKERQRKE